MKREPTTFNAAIIMKYMMSNNSSRMYIQKIPEKKARPSQSHVDISKF